MNPLFLLLTLPLDPEALAPATTSPTQSLDVQTTELNKTIRSTFAQLADPDPATRDMASEKLMGLRVQDLPILIDAVKAVKTVAPSQEIALHEIFMQICLTEKPYTQNLIPVGFLGVQLGPEAVSNGFGQAAIRGNGSGGATI
jgi:hypothetical protein